MTKLMMQFLRLNETCRMICYSILSNNVNLVEIGFEWLWRKTTVLCVLMRISPTKSTFSLGKNFDGTRHLCEKNEPTLDRFVGGGVHGKVCWLIAYMVHYVARNVTYAHILWRKKLWWVMSKMYTNNCKCSNLL